MVFELLPEATYLLEVTPEGRFRVIDVNPAFERLVGMPRAAAVGLHIEDTVPPATAEPLLAKCRACVDHAAPTETLIVLDLPVGRRVYRSKLIPRLSPDARVTQILGVSRDVTDEREPPATDGGEFQALVEHSPNQIGRYDADGRYLYVNPAGLRAIGRPLAALLGWRPTEVSDSSQAREVEAAVRGAIARGEPTVTALCVDAGEGTVHLQLRVTPERNRLGTVVSAVAVADDITPLKRAELEFRTLAEHAPDIIARFDREGRYVYINPAIERLTGIAQASFVGRLPGDLRLEGGELGGRSAVQPLVDAIARVWADETPQSAELDLPSLGGERHLAISLVPERGVDGRVVSVLGIGRDVTASQHAERSLRRINRALETLSSGNEALVRATSEAGLLAAMCRVLIEVGGRRAAWVAYLDRATPGALRPVAWAGEGVDEAVAVHLAGGCTASLCAEALRLGRPQVTHGCAVADVPLPFEPVSPLPAAFGAGVLRSAFAAPLFADDGAALGVLVVCSAHADAFDADEVTLLGELSSDLSYGLSSLRLRVARAEDSARVQRAMSDTIQALANTLDLRDPYTAGHQRRVTQLATALGGRLGLPEDRVQGLHFASVVHDIGKICVPAEILTRPGPLSPLEYALVQTHVEAGYDILKGIDFPWPLAEIVRQHHERLDGSGYPRGLAGDAILLEARILAVCDVVEAMSSHRPYRASLGLEAALAAIAEGRGARFDADVVDGCVALVAEGFAFS